MRVTVCVHVRGCVCVSNLAEELCDYRHHSVVLSEALVGHVPGCSLRADEDVSADRLKHDVLHIRSDPAVRLTEHGLWPQCGRHQEHLLPFQRAETENNDPFGEEKNKKQNF